MIRKILHFLQSVLREQVPLQAATLPVRCIYSVNMAASGTMPATSAVLTTLSVVPRLLETAHYLQPQTADPAADALLVIKVTARISVLTAVGDMLPIVVPLMHETFVLRKREVVAHCLLLR